AAQGGVRKSLDAVAVVGHEVAVGIQLEIAGAGDVLRVADRVPHDEKSTVRYRKVGRHTGAADGTAFKVVGDRGGEHAGAHLHRGGAGRRRARAARGQAQGVAEGVRELHARGLERSGVHIGDVVADDVHVFLKILQAADGRGEGAKHRYSWFAGLTAGR